MSNKELLTNRLKKNKILNTNKILKPSITQKNPLSPAQHLYVQNGRILKLAGGPPQQGGGSLPQARGTKCSPQQNICLTESINKSGDGYDYKLTNKSPTFNYVAVFFEFISGNFIPENIGKGVRETWVDSSKFNYNMKYEIILKPKQSDVHLVSMKKTIVPYTVTKYVNFNSHAKPKWYMNPLIDVGNQQPEHSAAEKYELPFVSDNKGLKISQGFNGEGADKKKITHKNKFAVDIPMPINTPVLAARDGIVIKVKQDSSIVGSNKKKHKDDSNHIIIKHDDGTYAGYAHLVKGGVKVKVGQFVKKGDHIGCSGNSGYSSGPHLHFEVFKIHFNISKIKWYSKEGNKNQPLPDPTLALKSVTIPWGFRIDNGKPPHVGDPPYVNPNVNHFNC